MTTKTIDCIDCGASVPYGRLSCPSCGNLLASVSGGRPPLAPQTVSDAVEANGLGPTDAGPDRDLPSRAASPDDSLLMAEPGTPQPVDPEPAAEPVLAARAYRPHTSDDDLVMEPAGPPPASAYRPPGLALADAGTGRSAWSPAAASMTMSAAGPAVSAEAFAVERPATSIADPVRVLEIAGWFVIVGSAMTALGFLLPWSRVVIGGRATGGYFDGWGLASPSHVVILLLTLAVLALGVMRTSVPAWITTGVAGLGLGALTIGLSWPYVIGPLGADVGVLIVALGGVALVVGGVVATWATRHVEVDSVV